MNYLSEADIRQINESLPGKSGYNILNAGALQEAANAPGREMFGKELDPYLGGKAAALVYPIAQSHPFQDGNKRTAYLALELFLNRNGYQIIPGQEDFVRDLVGRCAAHVPITKQLLGARLQMSFIKQGAGFIRI
jgi:death on curing protein